MSTSIAKQALEQLFLNARTFNSWLPQEVNDQTLHDLFDLLKWAPTSANLSPARFLFVKSGPAKAKLIPCLAEMNVEKVKTAPVTVVIAQDEKFYEQVPQLFPHAPAMRDLFASNTELAQVTAFRNSSLQGAYLILAARALGLDCGPMSGFDNEKLDTAFFKDHPLRSSWKSNFICNLGYGDHQKLFPRGPRLAFKEACEIL